MTSSTTFTFTSRSEMSGEYTFQFTPFQGTILFSHEWSLRCYNVWGRYSGNGSKSNIHLPYNTQLKVSGAWGKQNFGRLYVETLEVTSTSITVKYWIRCYHPGEWYSGLTYEGRLTCETAEIPEIEAVNTYENRDYDAGSPVTEFPLESMVYIQASDGITRDPITAECYIETQSGQSINVHLLGVIDPGDNFRKYRGFFRITIGETSDALDRLHMDEFEKATLQVDINGDSRFGTCDIWAVRQPPERVEKVDAFEDETYAVNKYVFNSGERVYVLATDGYTQGGTQTLRVVAQSGDVIRVTLEEIEATNYKGSFVVTDGPTDDEQNAVHLEPSERAVLRCDVNEDGTSADCQIARSPTDDEPGVETIVTYETNACAVEKDTFDWEEEVWIIATNLITTGGTKELTVITDSADQIHVTLTEEFLTRYRGYFRITRASTDDTLNQIHMDEGEKAILYCDIDSDGQAASSEIWCRTREEIPGNYATHYRIQVNTQQDMLGTMMWDSQKSGFINPVAPGERCPDIEYAGSTLDLSGQTTYWWRIKFWVSNGTQGTPWSTEEAYFIGVREIPPEPPIPPYDDDIRKPRGKAEVEIGGEWIDLQKVTAIQISNNKNPLDNIETAQGTVYLSNIDKEFYPDKTTSQFFDQLFGRRIRMSLGFLDYKDTGEVQFRQKMMGIVKNVSTDRIAQTAEIVALEFMDFYRKKQIKITPVYEDISLFDLYCELVRHCFPSWLNQTETADWNYWVDPLGFRRTNIYIGTGKLGGSEYIPIRDFSRTPPEWIYSIIPDSEAVYDDEGFRLKRGEDYEIILRETDAGTESWIHFLKLPYPTNEDGFYVAITVDIRVSIVQYKDTTLIEELEDIALVSDCRLYADEYGRLICRSNALEETVTDAISHDTNLMALSTRKDIDSIINHVVVESRPYQIGADVEVGIWEITFRRRPEAEDGVEFDFTSDEFVENFRFDLTWNLKCSQWLGECVGYGTEINIELPFTSRLRLAGAVGCTGIYGHLYIEPVAFDSNHITVKFYLDCIHEQHYDNAIVFSATLTCHAEGIGQPETYKGEAIDEASYQDRYIGRRKRTFTLDYLEPGDTQARQAAERILAGLRRIRVYYDCEVRGMPHLRLMDTVTLTEPKADLAEKKLQVIKLVDNMEVANYTAQIGLMERKVPSAVPWYWETEEQDFIINTQEQLIQTFKFIFDSEILRYRFHHNYFVDASWRIPIIGPIDMHGEGTDEYFDLPYTVDIHVYWEPRPDVTAQLGTLTITLIEETSTSIEIQYKLTVPGIENFLWPIDWLGTLSVEAQFASQSPGTDAGDAPPDQPHFPPDEPNMPPNDEPDDGWNYDLSWSTLSPHEEIRAYSDAAHTIEQYQFDAEETVYIRIRENRDATLGITALISGDRIILELTQIRLGFWDGSFTITNGPSDPSLGKLHLDPGEQAIMYCDVDEDGVYAEKHLSRRGIPPELPPPPTNLVATAIAGGTIQLTWIASSPETSVSQYNIYRATASEGQDYSSPTYSVSAGITAYDDIATINGQTYYYVVRAQAAADNIETNINEVSATAVAPEPPPPPSNLAAMAVNGLIIELTWAASSPETDVVQYNIYRAITSGGQNFAAPIQTVSSEITAFTDTFLLDGQIYHYVVRAQSEAGIIETNTGEVSATAFTRPDPPPSDFLLIAWPCGFPGRNVAAFKKYTDLGINCLMIYEHWWDRGFCTSTAYCRFLNDCFDAAAQAGVKMFVQIDNRTFVKDWKPFVPCLSADQGKPFVVQFKDKPAIAGWFIWDEPHCGRYNRIFDLKGDPAEHDGDTKFYTGLTDAQIAEWWPYGLPQTRWTGHADHSPYGGQMQGKMQYDLIRGQDPNAAHWTFSVWMDGFEANCPPYGWETRSIYYYCYTPGHEVGDIGAIDIYPSPADSIDLGPSLEISYTFPNGDGFSQIGEGMLGVINAFSDGPTPYFLLAQYEAWHRVYGEKLRGIGFWDPATWLQDNALGAEYRRQIKDLARRID